MVCGKWVFDFVCGLGFVGIVVMKVGVCFCWFVDIDFFVVIVLELNVVLNNVVLFLEEIDLIVGGLIDGEVVFCGDVFYDCYMVEKVLIFLDWMLDEMVMVYVGDFGCLYLLEYRLMEFVDY